MSDFTWCDLSTFALTKATHFYGAVLDWSPYLAGGGMGDDYTIMYADGEAAAGIFTMPDFFQKIRMPSFWMTYIRVESLANSVELAVKLGGKCEVEPTQLDANSQFALVRDPSGAGFSLFQGLPLNGRDYLARNGRMVWSELHVPLDAEIETFYQQLFGWEFCEDQRMSCRRVVHLPSGEVIASVLKLDEATKGPKNYWAVWFAIDDMPQAIRRIESAGGNILMRPGGGHTFCMATDNQGAVFCLTDRATFDDVTRN